MRGISLFTTKRTAKLKARFEYSKNRSRTSSLPVEPSRAALAVSVACTKPSVTSGHGRAILRDTDPDGEGGAYV